tara:strand:- start:96 stop:575 length:480 start_codon:yes stop_codon:yes gene_type:complete
MISKLFLSVLDQLSYPNAHHIINLGGNIWLGNHISALDDDFLQKNQITTVINCSKKLPFSKLIQHRYRIPVDDDYTFSSVIELKKILPLIHKKITQHVIHKKENILIHCRAGVQRSATTVCYFLMKELKWTKEYAMYYITSKRYIAFKPFVNFNLALDD